MSYSLLSLVDEPIKKRNYVFEMCISVNGRYIVIEDQVFDNVLQKNIGNIWESIDIFKTIFKNIDIENDEYKIIKESILDLPILENKENLYGLRDILLEFNFLEDTWVGREFKKSGKGITDFIGNSYEGLKKFNIAISKGDWTNIINLLSKGVKYTLRSLKDAMYSNIGGVVDAVLVATGIGKTFQWIPWALITSLDIYQLINNDWVGEDTTSPIWSKYLTIGFDILGLVGTGAMAVSAKKTMAPLKALSNNPSKMAQYLKNNPAITNILQKMKSGVNAASSRIKSAYSFLKTKFPGGAEFIGKIINSMDDFFKKFVDSINTLLKSENKIVKGTKAGAKDLGVSYGVEKALSGLSNIQIANLDNAANLLKKIGLISNTLNEAKSQFIPNIDTIKNVVKNLNLTPETLNIIQKENINYFKQELNKYLKEYANNIKKGYDVELIPDQIKTYLTYQVINTAIKTTNVELSEEALKISVENLFNQIKREHTNKTIKNTLNSIFNGFNLKSAYRSNRAKSDINKLKLYDYKPTKIDKAEINNTLITKSLSNADQKQIRKEINKLRYVENREEWLKLGGEKIDNFCAQQLLKSGITKVNGVSTKESGWFFKLVKNHPKKSFIIAAIIAITITGYISPGLAGELGLKAIKWTVRGFIKAIFGNSETPTQPDEINPKKQQGQPSFDEFLKENNLDNVEYENVGATEPIYLIDNPINNTEEFYIWDINKNTYVKI